MQKDKNQIEDKKISPMKNGVPFPNPKDEGQLKSGVPLELNKNNLDSVIKRRGKAKTLQTTLFTQNPIELKLHSNISDYRQFWQEFFPYIVDEHTALDLMHIKGIIDGNTKLERRECMAEFSLDFKDFKIVISILKSMMDGMKYDDLQLEIYGESLVCVSPHEGEKCLIIDKSSSLDVFIPENTKKNTIKNRKSQKIDLKEDLMVFRNQNNSIKLVYSKKRIPLLSNFSPKCNNLYESFFSFNQIIEILEIIQKFIKNNCQNDKLENQSFQLKFNFYKGFMIIQPIPNFKTSNSWKLTLASRV